MAIGGTLAYPSDHLSRCWVAGAGLNEVKEAPVLACECTANTVDYSLTQQITTAVAAMAQDSRGRVLLLVRFDT